ncbi:hypothetical protein [Rufibacter tibetensis]|uniref:DUF4369 domain-containing protein n=1 Tax=Rufibacter tibetensis TaxID=512763 RepID=A0A0P0C153_9BACT|nr:hypothetical protein [Rufibacter tibetensis]ALI98284.1 hypothetical protein DC20_03915 [Rufibacter tibetensis]
MKYLYLLLVMLFSLALKAQEKTDYIITVSGDSIAGKVTYAPGDKIVFRAAGQKKQVEFRPLEIKAYFHKGTLKMSKFNVSEKRAVFFYHYRSNEDAELFKEATGIEVTQKGKINLYHVLPIHTYNASSPGHVFFEIADSEDLYVSDYYNVNVIGLWDKQEAINTLATLVKSNPALHSRVSGMKGKFNFAFIDAIVKEYNSWYALESKKLNK